MLEKLACQLGRKDEKPNIELAEYLCQQKDFFGIKEIVDGFKGTDKAIANDCIKVLYEIAERNPKLISDYANEFISSLPSKNNRLVWGSMLALAKIAEYASQPIFEKLSEIKSAYEKGSVITVDNSISVFAKLCKANDRYAETVLPILINHFEKCSSREVPQHAERAEVCYNRKNASEFIKIFEKRLTDLTPSGLTRLNKLMRKLHNLQ